MNIKYNKQNYAKSRELINKKLASLRTQKTKIEKEIGELVLLRDFIRHNYH